jgi:hypothetical protein
MSSFRPRLPGAGLVVAIVALMFAASPAGALANNRGDVWVDNVGQPSGPGHEQDPHLACQDINLWGAGLANSTGAYTIDGWPPSGSMKQAYSSTWTYTGSGPMVTSVINVGTLIANAMANGDKPINKQGFHFKLQFVQDPQKHKTFWVNCPEPGQPPPSSPGTPGTTPGTTPPTTTTTSTTSPTSAVKGVTKHKKHKKHKKHTKHKVKAKTISRPPKVSSGFTG